MAESAPIPAIELLEQGGVPYRLVEYGRVRSAEEAAEARGVALASLVKTLVIRTADSEYVLALIPATRALSYPKLRRLLGVRRLTMPDPDEARAATGYERGTITPLAAGPWMAIVDRRVLDQNEISLGSGRHGLAIHLSPEALLPLIRHEVGDISD